MAAMTFLQLGQSLAAEAGASGSLTTMQSQLGEFGRFVNWINAGWMDIQRLHQDWDWMRTSASVPTVTGQANYPLASFTNTVTSVVGLADFGMWARQTGRNYDSTIGLQSEIFMDYLDYDEWRDMYYYGALRFTQSRPNVFAIQPSDHSICLGPVPIAGYTFEMDYFKTPSVLVNDADAPALPQQFQMAIVYRALYKYARYERDSQLMADAQAEYDPIIRQMNADRLPQMRTGATLA